MLFNSFIFLIFLSLVVPIYYSLSHKNRIIFLLVCSYFFYGYWDWRFCSLLLISTLIDYFVGRKIFSTSDIVRKKLLLSISLISNLGILGFFKYFNFFTDSFNALISNFGLQLDYLHLNIILPVGISFYTFQTLSYTIDIYRKKLEPTNSFLDFALYVAFFPQLVAGPIERAVNLLPQISSERKFSISRFKEGIILISVGMFKKVMIGDTSGRIVDQIFASPNYYTSIELLMGLILFAIQIYSDFSGYSSIARGTAKLIGYELMVNFNQPYLSKNITEFWRRWHISLSSWLRDYLYIPLGGNRKGKKRTYLNLMLTMLIGGLWHGANWTFVVWGGLHGIYLALHKYFLRNKDENVSQKFWGLTLGKIIGTNLIVLLTWLFFRADSFSTAFYFLSNIFFWSPSEYTFRILTIIMTYISVTLIIDFFEYKTGDHTFLLRLESPYRYGIIAASWFITLLYLFQSEPAPFIYFQF